MLSKNQQMLLIRMLYRDVSMKSHNVYQSKAFYRTVKYLEGNHLVKKVPKDEGTGYILELSMKGRFLARLLASFTDVDEKIRSQYGAE